MRYFSNETNVESISSSFPNDNLLKVLLILVARSRPMKKLITSEYCKYLLNKHNSGIFYLYPYYSHELNQIKFQQVRVKIQNSQKKMTAKE